MSESTLDSSPPVLSFFDSFLQERNIKWLLAIGALILLGSSLMLITSHWGSYTPLWKYSIMLAYTAAIYLAGNWSYHRLGLRKTGTSLLALTLVLIPALFLSLAWVNSVSSGSKLLPYLVMLSVTTLFAVLTSRRLLQHFLKSSQISFEYSYLGLCVSASLSSTLPSTLLPWTLFALWLLFTVGVIKVNRHVFWLTEQQQAPRIFAFFPIALLGGIFITTFGFNFYSYIASEWLGLICALTAIPILFTADAAANVFSKRTGDLIKQRPPTVIIPLLVGLILSVSALALSFTGLRPNHTALAITPTAALVALILFRVAQRTAIQSFVWALLICITIAYNFSPFYFQQLAQQLIANSATAVNEPSLPFAFYGLSYLPLLIAFIIIGNLCQRKDFSLFAQPLQYFSTGLAIILLGLATTHTKALFPVAACMLALFTIQTFLLQQRWLALFALLTGTLAAYAWPAFSVTILDFTPWWHRAEFFLAIYAFLLLIPGYKIDIYLQRLPHSHSWQRFIQCQWLSLAIVLALIPQPALTAYTVNQYLLLASALTTILLILCLRIQRIWFSIFAIIFTYISGTDILVAYNFSFSTVVSLLTLSLALQWGLGYLFRRASQTRISLTFATANQYIAQFGLLILFCLVYLPLTIADAWQFTFLKSLAPWLSCQLLVLLILFDMARHNNSTYLTWFAGMAAIVISGSLWLQTFGSTWQIWLPTLWTSIAAIILTVLSLAKQLGSAANVTLTSKRFSVLILCLAAIASLGIYKAPAIIAGGLASMALLINATQQPQLRRLCIAMLNWQLIAGVIVLLAPVSLATMVDLINLESYRFIPSIALISALSILSWRYFFTAQKTSELERIIDDVQLWALIIVCSLSLWLCWQMPAASWVDALCAISALLVLAAAAFLTAYQKQREAYVWLTEGLLILAFAALALRGYIQFGNGWSPFILLSGAVLLLCCEPIIRRSNKLAIATRPVLLTSLVLPLITATITVYQILESSDTYWAGRNSLVLLLAAAFYFWYGYERAKQWSILAGIFIANLALALLWYELSWSDPQLFMIPIGASILFLRHLLAEQMPASFHTPLNYLGALIILVSPMFHIATGSWLHIFSLMLISVTVIVLAIGLRIKALMYTGTAFLLTAMIAVIVRGSVDNPNLLWLAGLLLGAAVVALAALAERNREQLLQRVRLLSTTLANWQ